ncbi:unnamed protein product [Cyprideis torosa]|uniref:DUF7921 domain-containing protein n=1 Tax=Cyprideis torosa TaxID=163714 RepID=A0A7R8ZR62_9CRUS|nr:unnamed protein product [Cyprideis torosa]CAG0892266.1 unnamed protein product [Cyprideis torosa]
MSVPTDMMGESSGTYLYNSDSDDCLTMCDCMRGLRLRCNTLGCVPKASCHSPSGATYGHQAPAYIAFRDECLCFSGNFICPKPPPDHFRLREDVVGVFLFLGFSKLEENILRRYTNETVNEDAGARLQELISPRDTLQTRCHLVLYHSVDENLIFQASFIPEKPDHSGNGSRISYAMLWEEKKECGPLLQSLAYRIRNRDFSVISQPTLSLIKVAHVEVHLPPEPRSGARSSRATSSTSSSISLKFVFVCLVQLLHWTAVASS